MAEAETPTAKKLTASKSVKTFSFSVVTFLM
jgi:hypothetical protein